MSNVKMQWIKWAELFAKKTGKCPGTIPGFGLPTDQMTEEEFRQTVAGLSLHRIDTCTCWPKEIPNYASVLPDVKEVFGNALNQQLTSADGVEVKLNLTERHIRERLAMMKEKAKQMIDAIGVDNFRVEDGHVRWSVRLPKGLGQLFEAFKGTTPPDFKEEKKDQLPEGVLPYEPAE